MPIERRFAVGPMTADQYYSLDHRMMRIAFDIHNELGRLNDELIYKRELEHRARKAGIRIQREAQIKVSYREFSKDYFIDLLAGDAVVYEMKTAEAIAPAHLQQTLNYLFLSGLQHGKIINMRPLSVKHRFVCTTLTPQQRHMCQINTAGWTDLDPDSVWLREFVVALIEDWGAFLDIRLFYEAIRHFRGGPDSVIQPVVVRQNGRDLGMQSMNLLNPLIAFVLSAHKDSLSAHGKHLKRLLEHTSLKVIHWINFNRHDVRFETFIK